MRIAIFDNWLKKFTQPLIDYWEKQGHQVMWEPGFNPNLIETCDRVFFESADTNAHLATQQRPHKKGKVFVRVVDIDAHVNGPAGLKEGYFDGIIYIADYIKQMCDERYENLKGVPAAVIPMGVDVNKFTFREKPRGKKIAFIATRLTAEKGFDRALMIFRELQKHSNQWELHVVGRMFENSVWEMHINKLMEGLQNVHMYDNLPYNTGNEINEFLQDKDYLLLTSHKEAFSFATGEAMAKGIKPIIYTFKGAEDIWPKNLLFRNEHEAVQLFEEEVHTPELYRKYIEDNYTLEQHIQKMNEFMEII